MNFTLNQSKVQTKFMFDNFIFSSVLILFNYITNIITPPPQLLINTKCYCLIIEQLKFYPVGFV